MNLFDVLILSVVEGITEFLPVSSTGHLILTSALLKLPTNGFLTTFEIIIQFGAILAVLFLYGKLLFKQSKLWGLLLAGFLPSAVIGFILYKIIKEFLLTNQFIPVVSLIIGGVILLFFEKIFKPKTLETPLKSINLKKAFLIGMFQILSIIPGVSRSAATITGGMILGLNKKRASEFSFLLAVPTMTGATALDLFESKLQFNNNEYLLLALGVFLSFLSALAGIKFLIKFVEKHSFAVFGVYRIIIGIVFYLFLLR